ncbi:MAG: 4-hydroxy-tetrahydrodipicolinate reductase [Bacteroidales bacterium]|jgi:4-hydroxy-tetrahydrodipicolinate reductase|nr:4-hydroxy-tetrahydrodipicolinate reductase [Bacteroidales bacterium]
MKIAILGYGKMGEQIEKTALERKHTIAAYIDNEKDWIQQTKKLQQADIAIDFSMPNVVVENIYKCFALNLPIVVGTTGWHHQLKEVKEKCLQFNQSLLYASNFSLGVNLFFALNRALAKIMNGYDDFDVSIEEIHHTAKKDSPSGTAIVLANDIIRYLPRKETWVNEMNEEASVLSIKSERISNNIGTHLVTYASALDSIEIKHTSLSRKSFATGAVLCAEWLSGKHGFFSINDMLQLSID